MYLLPFPLQIIIYLFYACAFLSAWTVTTFTAERWIVVFHPLHRHRICTPRRARYIILGLVLIALVIYSFSTWTSGVEHTDGTSMCTPYPEYFILLKVLTSIDAFLVLVVPSVIIIVLNVGITAKICHFVHRKRVNSFNLNHLQHDHKEIVRTKVRTAHSPESGRKLKVPRELTCNKQSTSNSSSKESGSSKSSSSHRQQTDPYERETRFHRSCRKAGSCKNSDNMCGSDRKTPNGSPVFVCTKSKLRSSQSTCTFQKVSSGARHGHTPCSCSLHNYQLRITRSLVMVSTFFVVLNLPR